MRRVLSIDWDYFFGTSWWESRCGACSWVGRGCATVVNSKRGFFARPTVSEVKQECTLNTSFKQPLVSTEGLKDAKIKGAELYVAECHADILDIIQPKDFVTNFDAHADAGDLVNFNGNFLLSTDSEGMFHCGNWVTVAEEIHEAKVSWISSTFPEHSFLHWWLPSEPDPKHFLLGGPIAAVFLCQSRPWTPSYADQWFHAFIHALSVKTKSEPIFMGPHKSRLRRAWNRTQPGRHS